MIECLAQRRDPTVISTIRVTAKEGRCKAKTQPCLQYSCWVNQIEAMDRILIRSEPPSGAPAVCLEKDWKECRTAGSVEEGASPAPGAGPLFSPVFFLSRALTSATLVFIQSLSPGKVSVHPTLPPGCFKDPDLSPSKSRLMPHSPTAVNLTFCSPQLASGSI